MSRVLRLGRGSAKRVRAIQWSLGQVIGLTLLLTAFAAGCVGLAMWINAHPIAE